MDDPRHSFEALALPHLDAAYNLARWLARSPSDAEDIVQEAMLRAYRAFGGFRGDNVRPWLLAIVRNCWRTKAAEVQRRGHSPIPDEADQPLVDGAADPEAEALRSSESRRLSAVISALPEAFREVLILREVEDLSYQEIAEATGTPIGTVMSRLARARAMLRDQWLKEAADDLR